MREMHRFETVAGEERDWAMGPNDTWTLTKREQELRFPRPMGMIGLVFVA